MRCTEMQEMELPSGQVLLTRCTREAPHPPDGHDYAFKLPYTFVGGAVFRLRTNAPAPEATWPTAVGSMVYATPAPPYSPESGAPAGEWVLVATSRDGLKRWVHLNTGAVCGRDSLHLERVIRVGDE